MISPELYSVLKECDGSRRFDELVSRAQADTVTHTVLNELWASRLLDVSPEDTATTQHKEI